MYCMSFQAFYDDPVEVYSYVQEHGIGTRAAISPEQINLEKRRAMVTS